MMPPPESSMVPMASRRPSLNIPATNEVHSPPMHPLKQEYIDENSQGSLSEHDRYRHLSESSLDVHHGDSNMPMINDNSIDMMHQNSLMSQINENSNISVGNEESVDIIVRRNSISRQSIINEDSVSVDILSHSRSSMSRPITSVCEASLDCASNHMVSIKEDSSCNSNISVTDRSILPQLLTNDHSSTTMEKVMDLRMKLPMGTVADLANTTAPSMAALQRFGIVSSSTLPNQSAQSVENYLTKIEAKPALIPMNNPTGLLMKNDISQKLSQIINNDQSVFQFPKMSVQHCDMVNSNAQNVPYLTPMPAGKEPVFLSSSGTYISNNTQNEAINIITKSESADVADTRLSQQTNTMVSSTITTIANALERSVPTPINTERLDALVNSTVDSHLSPTKDEESTKDALINGNMSLNSSSNSTEMMITSQDVMLNSQNSLMVPPLINTRLSPVLAQPDITSADNSANLTSDVILNSQISPSLMCRTSNGLQQESLLPSSNLNICQPTTAVESALLSNMTSTQQPHLVANANRSPESINSIHSPIAVSLSSESEKAVLYKAAVDLLEAQKKLTLSSKTTSQCDMVSISPNNNSLSQLQTGSSFVRSPFTTNSGIQSIKMCKEQKSDYILQPIAVKDSGIAASVVATNSQNDKRNEDRMIPQSFTSLTENELINLINPSCFDQGNNMNNYH